MQNNQDPKYTKNVYNALKTKVEGFNKTEEEFVASLQNPEYVKNVHNALTKKVDGFNKSFDEFSSLVLPVKKKVGTKDVTSTSTTNGQNLELAPKNGSLGSQKQVEWKPIVDVQQKTIKNEDGSVSTIEQEKEVFYRDKKTGELKPAKEKVEKGVASTYEQKLAEKEALQKRAKKSTTPTLKYEEYKNSVEIPEERKAEFEKEIDDALENRGFMNGLKTGLKQFWNNVLVPGAPIELNPYAKEQEQAKEILMKEFGNDESKITPETLKAKTKEIVLNNRIDAEKINVNNEFLSNLPKEEKSKLELEGVENYKTISDKNKYLLTESKVILGDLEKIAKDGVVINNIIKEYTDKKQELPEKFIESTLKMQEEYDKKIERLTQIENEYQTNTDDLGSVEEELDFLKRNYNTVEKVKSLAKLGFGDLWVNVTKKLPIMISDLDESTLEKIRFGSEGVMNEQERQELIDEVIDWENAKELERNKFKRDVDFNYAFTSPTAFGEFFAQELGNQIPIFTQIAMPGGVVSMGITSAADKYGQLETESNQISFLFNGKQMSGFQKEDGTIVDLQGNAFNPDSVQINSIQKPDYSKSKMLITSVGFGMAEAILGSLPTKGIMSRSAQAINNAGQRTLLRQGIKEYTKDKAKNFVKDTSLEAVSEGLTQVTQNFLDRKVLGKKEVGIMDGVSHAAFSGGMFGAGINISGGVAGTAMRMFSDNKSGERVRNNIKVVFDLQSQLNNPEISEASRQAIREKIEALETENQAILTKVAETSKNIPKEVFEAIVDTNRKQEILTLQAEEIRKDMNLSPELKKELIQGLEVEYNTLEKKRSKLVSENANVLDALPDSQVNKLKTEASRVLVAEAEAQGKTEATFTDEQISKKAIEIYNQSNQNAVQQETPITETQQETQPKTEVQETEQEVLETNTESDIERRRQETEAKIKRKDLFSDGGVFANELGGSGVNSIPTNHREVNGIEFVEFSNPNTGVVDVIMTGTSDSDFVGYYRLYENGKPTNKWSSKFENQSRNKENFKTMISGVQEMLPQGHEYTEKTSISTDGLRVWNQQLSRGYELQYDNNGNLIINTVAINGDAIVNELGIDVNQGNFDNISVTNKEQFELVKKALLPYLQKFGLDESNIYWTNGTVEIDLPVLKKTETTTTQPANISENNETTPTTNTATDGNIRPRVEPMAEVGGTTEQIIEGDTEQNVQSTAETKPTEKETELGKVQLGKTARSEFSVRRNNENGNIIVYNSKGEVETNQANDVLFEYAKTQDLTQGKTSNDVIGEGVILNPNESDKTTIDTSENPAELAEVALRTQVLDYVQENVDSDSRIILEYLSGSVDRNSFIRWSDANNIVNSIARTFFKKKGSPVRGQLDSMAQELSEILGREVEIQELVDAMLNYPNGLNDLYKQFRDENSNAAKNKFMEVTGLPANDRILKEAVRQQIAKEKLEQQVSNSSSLDALSDEQMIELYNEQQQFIQEVYGTEEIITEREGGLEVSNIEQREEVSENKGDDGKVDKREDKSDKQKRVTDEINDILSNWDKRLKDFGDDTLGINIPVVIARGAIKAMKLANNGIATIEDVVQAGIDYIKYTDWYNNLDTAKKAIIDKNTFQSIMDSTIKANNAAKKTIKSLREKIKENKINNKQLVADIKNFLANNSIDGVLTPTQTNTLITKANEILVAKNTLKAFDEFVDFYNKVKDKAENKLNEKAKAKLKFEQRKQKVLDLKSKGMSLPKIINEIQSEKRNPLTDKEKQMIEMIFNTADVASLSDTEISEAVNKPIEKSRQLLRDSNKPWQKIKDSFVNLRTKFLDSAADAKRILDKSNLVLVKNRLIAVRGASARAEMVFNDAKKKIYGGLNTFERNKLDEIIFLRRTIAVDSSRASKGLTPVLHQGGINGEMAQRQLDILRRELGNDVFLKLENRADAYFDEFRSILNDMQKSGLISETTKNELIGIDYQPRVFLHHVLKGGENLSTEESSWQKSTFGLSGDQIMSLEEGSVESMAMNSEWLLAVAINMRSKAMAMNAVNTKLIKEVRREEARVNELKQKDPKDLTKAEKKKIKAFENLSKTFIDNPIIGVNKSGNPKYKFEKAPDGYRTAYYYVNGVQNKFFIEEKIYEQWYNEKRFINNTKALEQVSKFTGTKLLKAMATGRNPFFLITNVPRDFISTLIVSPEYSKFKPLAVGQLLNDLRKGIKNIAKEDAVFQKYFEYGGGMSFLSTQGMLTNKSTFTYLLEDKYDNKYVRAVLDANVKEKASNVFDWATLNQINQYSEIIFRIAIFKRSIENQLKEISAKDIDSVKDIVDSEGNVVTPKQEVIDDIYYNAVSSARSVMDFNQGGYITKDMESVMPYLNAATQGTRVLADALQERPLETVSNITQLVAMGTLSVIGWSVASMALSDDDDEKSPMEKYLDAYSKVGPHDRRNYNIIFTGRKDEDGNWEYIKIAKAQQITPFTEIVEHHTINLLRTQNGLKEKGNLLDKLKTVTNDNISPIQFMSFTDDPTLLGVSAIARNPFGRAAMTYATGFDFYRQEKLSWDIGERDVPKFMEGYSSDRVDDFYKKMGEDIGLSPIRTKAMVESFVTSPSTNPYLSLIYGGLDGVVADKDASEKLVKMRESMAKNVGKRLVGHTKEYNATLEDRENLKKEIEKIQAEKIKLNKRVDEIAKAYINKTESAESLQKKLIKELQLNPYKAQQIKNRIDDKIKFKDVDRFLIDLKYETNNEVKALLIFNEYGDLREVEPKKLQELQIQSKRIGLNLSNKEIWAKYNELLEQYEREK